MSDTSRGCVNISPINIWLVHVQAARCVLINLFLLVRVFPLMLRLMRLSPRCVIHLRFSLLEFFVR